MWVALLVASLALVLASLAQARAAGPPVLALLSAVHLQPQGRAYRSSFLPSLLDDLNLQAYLVDLCQIIPALTLTSIRKSLLVVPYGQVAWSFRSKHCRGRHTGADVGMRFRELHRCILVFRAKLYSSRAVHTPAESRTRWYCTRGGLRKREVTSRKSA